VRRQLLESKQRIQGAFAPERPEGKLNAVANSRKSVVEGKCSPVEVLKAAASQLQHSPDSVGVRGKYRKRQAVRFKEGDPPANTGASKLVRRLAGHE